MKIGIGKTEEGYGRWGEDSYKKMKEHGFDCADFGMSDTSSWVYSLPEEDVISKFSHERKLAEDAGVEIWQVHGPWRFPLPEMTPEGRIIHMENCKKSIRLTSVLGSKYWIIHPLMPCGWEDEGFEKETWEINVEFFKELTQYAKEYNVTICLENMPFVKFSISKPEEILRLVETIDDENFRICLDTGHVGIFEDLSVGEAVHVFGDKLRTLHIHDTIAGHDLHTMPYFGRLDWNEFVSALKEIGFEGVFNLETLPSAKADNNIFEVACKALLNLAKEMSRDI